MARSKREDEAKRLRRYIDRIEAAEKWRDNAFKEKWRRYYKQWRNVVDQLTDRNGKPITDRSNISIPYSFTMLETILPRLVETLFAGRPYVTMKGRRKEYAGNAEKMEKLIDYQQNEVVDMQDLFHIGLKICGLYGTTVAYVGWKYSEKSVIRKQMAPVGSGQMDPATGQELPLLDEQGEPITELQPFESNEVQYDDPEAKFLDLGLFFVDPDAEDIQPARFCGHSCYKTKEELQEMADQGLITLDWKKISEISQQNTARNDRMTSVGIPAVTDLNLQQADHNQYEVHYYWEDDKCVIIINRCFLAKEGPNPFWHKEKPYVKDVYVKVPGEFYGIGLMEIIEDLQAELNTERNQRIDYRSMSMRRMFKVRRGANINRQQLVWKQGGTVEVDEMDDIDVFEAPDSNVASSFNQEEATKQDMRDATGAHDVVMGTSPGGETATTTMTKDNNASMRFKLIISSVEKRLLLGITRLMMQLDQQFIDAHRILDITGNDDGDEWIEISPEEIQGDFRLIAAGSSVEPMANKEAFKQRMVELYGVVSQDPFMQQYPDKRRNLLKKLFESFDIADVDKLLPTDEELNGAMEQQMLQALMSRLPPQVQQLVVASLHQGAPMSPPGPPSHPPEAGPSGGGANTAAMQEQGLQMAGGGSPG